MRGGATDRLRWLRIAALVAAAGLLARLGVVQVARHQRYLDKAESQWRSAERLAPERGNLYDRSGRSLALSATTWRVGVSPDLAARPEAVAAHLAGPLRADAGRLAGAIRQAGKRHLVLGRDVVLEPAQEDTLRLDSAVTLERFDARIYPLDGVGASLIGFYRDDGEHEAITTGLERTLSATLAGTPGQAFRLKTALPTRDLGMQVLQPPVHGRHVVLTIDADVQAICEEELRRAIAEDGARGGAVLVADPQTGEILAAAASPLIADRRREGGDPAVWNNFNFTGVYEPGSVFKIVTSCALLRAGALDTATVIDCSNDNFGSFRIHNSEGHSYGPLSFMGAFAKSSNIYFARVVSALKPRDYYRALTDFGFGSRTRIPYQGEPVGLLARPERWSVRSQATMAIGQEIAVTPLQLVMAGCAVANGGELLAPQIVREVCDHDQTVRERRPRQVVRRVMPERTARVVREAMARAADKDGTGHEASVAWTRVGGKTGTAQKVKDGRYTDATMASFLGIVPVGQPRLVVLTILDEPNFSHRYAAQSAAPLFARIVEGIRRSTEWLTGVEGPDPALTLASRPAPSLFVPDVLYLSSGSAAEALRQAGLVLGGGERGGLVVEQVPGAGTRCAPGDTVRVTLAPTRGAAPLSGQLCPDLLGLSNRQVTRLAARLGLPVTVEGVGYVAAQDPPAGAPLDSVVAVKVVMEPTWP